MKTKRPYAAILTIVLIFILFCNLASAKNNDSSEAGSILANPESPQQQDQKPGKNNQNKISRDAVKLFIKQVEFYGQIAKPQAVFIFAGADPKVDGLKIDRQFFDLIFRNVEKSSLKHVRKRDAKNKEFIQW
ncbi:hypothetical protein B6I21_01430 [candidate division KSB1 bacterium 4572_119]|nr:MAG: hypothetical protein B6I21_01430 [candidate division KSB1 bacterium 4572_119]